MISSSSYGTEGDIVTLETKNYTVAAGKCLEFDFFLVLSPMSTNNEFSVLQRSAEMPWLTPKLLHRISSWTRSGWHRLKLPLPVGFQKLEFSFTLGIPYQSLAALDNVAISPCVGSTTVYAVPKGNIKYCCREQTDIPNKNNLSTLQSFRNIFCFMSVKWCPCCLKWFIWHVNDNHEDILWPQMSTMFQHYAKLGDVGILVVGPVGALRAPSQYKDRLIYVWRFPC